MNDNESSEKQNDDYESQLVKTNKEILSNIQDFIKQAVWTSIVTLGLAVLYAVLCIFFISPKTDVKNCLKEIGTIIPLFIVVSAIAVDWGFRIMRLAVGKWDEWKAEKEQRDAKLRAENKAKIRKEVLAELKAKGVDVSKVESKPQE